MVGRAVFAGWCSSGTSDCNNYSHQFPLTFFPTLIASHLDQKTDASPHYWADNNDWRGLPAPLRDVWEGEAARYQQAEVCQHQHQTDLHQTVHRKCFSLQCMCVNNGYRS